MCCILSLVLLFPLACSQRQVYRPGKVDAGMDVSAGIKQRKHVTDKRTYELFNELKKEGVIILTMGQDYRVIVPIDKLFYSSSPRIMKQSYGMLNRVVDYLKQFRKVSVNVSAYSKDDNKVRAGALSYARAAKISDYLWSQAIDTRLIHTQAHSIGSNEACCTDTTEENGFAQSSVEISFRNVIL
jgi:intracellular multiplication protein IcmN